MDDIVLRNMDAELIGYISDGNQTTISLIAQIVIALLMEVILAAIGVAEFKHSLTIRDINRLYIVRSFITDRDNIRRIICCC